MVQQLKAIIQVLKCSRRQQKQQAVSHSNSIATKRVSPQSGGCDAKKSTKSTPIDVGDVSTDDISDHSRHLSGSSDSEADSTTPDLSTKVKATLLLEAAIPSTPQKGNMPFAPPPGLELDAPRLKRPQATHPWSQTCSLVERHVTSKRSAQSPWNTQAAPFVPATLQPAGRSAPDTTSNLMALKQALDRLAPSEIATVKSILESKMTDDAVANKGPVNKAATHWSPSEACLGAPTARRPFTPFQGGRTQPMQRCSKVVDTKPTTNQDDSSVDTLRTFLRDLSLVDNGRVLTLRKISKLGLNSGALLETYFSKFGKVDRIMVSHTLCKNNQHSSKTRVRPAALGFALMSTVDEAEAALKQGESHMVAGVEISVQSFQSHTIDGTD